MCILSSITVYSSMRSSWNPIPVFLLACLCVFFLPILIWFCVQLSIQLSKFFRKNSYEFFGASLHPPFGGLVYRSSSEPQTSHQERWSREYIERTILSQAAVRVQYIWRMSHMSAGRHTAAGLVIDVGL